jgi:hypothetical protein
MASGEIVSSRQACSTRAAASLRGSARILRRAVHGGSETAQAGDPPALPGTGARVGTSRVLRRRPRLRIKAATVRRIRWTAARA